MNANNSEQVRREQKRARMERKYPGMFEKLGTVYDITLARKHGLSNARVAQMRRDHGIASFGRRDATVESKVGATPAAPTPVSTESEDRKITAAEWELVGKLWAWMEENSYGKKTIKNRVSALKSMLRKHSFIEIASVEKQTALSESKYYRWALFSLREMLGVKEGEAIPWAEVEPAPEPVPGAEPEPEPEPVEAKLSLTELVDLLHVAMAEHSIESMTLTARETNDDG